MARETSEKRAERIRLHGEFAASGQSLRAFAAGRGVSEWIVRQAIRKTEAEQQSATGFQELTAIAGSCPYVVRLRNGRVLELGNTFNQKTVEQLIGVLERC